MVPEIINQELNNFLIDCVKLGKIEGVSKSEIENILPYDAGEDLVENEDGKPMEILFVEFDRDEGKVTYQTRKCQYKISDFEAVSAGFGKFEINSRTTSMMRNPYPKKIGNT